MSHGTDFGEPEILSELNTEVTAGIDLLSRVGDARPEIVPLCQKGARLLELFTDHINASLVSENGIPWWVIEGSTSAHTVIDNLRALRSVNFQDPTIVGAWVEELEDTLAKIARADAGGGNPVGNSDDRRVVQSMVRRSGQRLEDELTLLRAIGDAQEVRAEIEASAVEASTAAAAATSYAEHSKVASGVAGARGMAGYFQSYGTSEAKAANAWRIATVVALIAIAAYAILHVPQIEALSASQAAARLAVSLPLIAGAGYCARESTHHRNAARWASTLGVQLQTIDAYCDPLPQDQQDALRAEFGRRVFSGLPLPMRDMTARPTSITARSDAPGSPHRTKRE